MNGGRPAGNRVPDPGPADPLAVASGYADPLADAPESADALTDAALTDASWPALRRAGLLARIAPFAALALLAEASLALPPGPASLPDAIASAAGLLGGRPDVAGRIDQVVRDLTGDDHSLNPRRPARPG